jgi:hypothetical protein
MRQYEVNLVGRVYKTYLIVADGQVDAEEKARQEAFLDDFEDIEEVLDITRVAGEPHEDDDDYEEPEEDEDEDDDGDWYMDPPDLGAK